MATATFAFEEDLATLAAASLQSAVDSGVQMQPILACLLGVSFAGICPLLLMGLFPSRPPARNLLHAGIGLQTKPCWRRLFCLQRSPRPGRVVNVIRNRIVAVVSIHLDAVPCVPEARA